MCRLTAVAITKLFVIVCSAMTQCLSQVEHCKEFAIEAATGCFEGDEPVDLLTLLPECFSLLMSKSSEPYDM